MQGNSACVYYSGVSSLRRAFTTLMHYAENECAMPIGLHCNEIRALCLITNALCRTAEIGALLLKCVLIVYTYLAGKRCIPLLVFARAAEGRNPPKSLNFSMLLFFCVSYAAAALPFTASHFLLPYHSSFPRSPKPGPSVYSRWQRHNTALA